MRYVDLVHRAAINQHMTWCDHPMCVHTPFPDDLALAETLLAPLGPDIDAEETELQARRARDAEISEGLQALARIDAEWVGLSAVRDAAVGLRAALSRLKDLV